MSDKKKKNKILYLSFNKDRNCLSLGMQTGYRIYDLTKKDSFFFYERIFGKGVGIIEMLEKTNILGLVGGGEEPLDMKSKLIIFDDKEGKNIAYLIFKSDVLNLRLKRDKILVICKDFIYLVDTLNFKSIDTISLNIENTKSISFAFTLEPEVNKLAYNDTNEEKNKIIINTYEEQSKKNSLELKANYKNNNIISCMEFDKEGKVIAVTAKNLEYLIVYRTADGIPLCKCNIDNQSVNCLYISFEGNNDFLCVSLDSGEVNIFNLKKAKNRLNNGLAQNKKDMKEEIWSKFYLPEKKVICTFTGEEIGKEHIICIGTKGNYYLAKFDSNKSGNLAQKIEEKFFLKFDK